MSSSIWASGIHLDSKASSTFCVSACRASSACLPRQCRTAGYYSRSRTPPFIRPVLARFASDGTLKMLAYLLLLYDPDPPPFIGIEEPENFLHPRLLYELAEECRAASERTQLLVTTHSPFFLDALRPEEVRILWRDEHGHTQARCVDQVRGVPRVCGSWSATRRIVDGGSVPSRRSVGR